MKEISLKIKLREDINEALELFFKEKASRHFASLEDYLSGVLESSIKKIILKEAVDKDTLYFIKEKESPIIQ